MGLGRIAASIVGRDDDAGMVDPHTERMSYADYLDLDRLLDAQHPLTDAHDELLFIVQHQTSELWMRLAVHELDRARRSIADDRLQPASKMLARVSRIFEQLNSAWDVLRTMTPSDYTEFRQQLGQSSGFQSFQYRQIEFMLGNRNPAMVEPHHRRPQVVSMLAAELARPSLYDEALRLLARSGLGVPASVLERDISRRHVADAEVVEAWRQIYAEPERWWPQYELAEKLVDLEDYFRRWRFNHVTTVERVIGFKPGTGGTGGVSYLKRMLEVELFPELWQVRTVL
jgi:tryptophan 2,3-dioxygenase